MHLDIKLSSTYGEDLSPLSAANSFINVNCPQCGTPAKRDADTMDTFVCSSWYYLRYPNANYKDGPFDPDRLKWLPVDCYIGGAEHATMHLLYARFITKALRDGGYLKFDEPFTKLYHQGTITKNSAKIVIENSFSNNSKKKRRIPRSKTRTVQIVRK